MALGQKTGGRKKGTPNKITAAIKDAIIAAAEAAHEDGTVGYLTEQAKLNPVAFMGLLGKVLPLQITGDSAAPIRVVQHVIIDPQARE